MLFCNGNPIIQDVVNGFMLTSSKFFNCSGDNELARKINDYLMDKIDTQSDYDTIIISLSGDEAEIVLQKISMSKENIRSLLNEF
jgi:hypothetical protein